MTVSGSDAANSSQTEVRTSFCSWSRSPRPTACDTRMEMPEPMRVVRSDQKGVMQHLTFSWQVSGNDFEYLPQVSPSSQLFNRSLNGWLESLSTEDRERAVDALFSVLRSSHADSISDLMAAGLKAVPTMINTFVGLSEADRRHLIEAMGLLMAAVRSRSSR